MAIEIILDLVHSPRLVYDGFEPEKIDFEIKNKAGELVGVADFCKAGGPWIDTNREEQKEKIKNLLVFPKKHIIDKPGVPSRVEYFDTYLCPFLDKKSGAEYLVYYRFFEKQQARYQCIVLAVACDPGNPPGSSPA